MSSPSSEKQDAELASDLLDLLHKALDLLRDVLGALDAEGRAPDRSLLKGVVFGLYRAASDLGSEDLKGPEKRPQIGAREPGRGPPALQAGPPRYVQVAPESVRVEKVKLDELLLQAEGLLQAKQSIAERAFELKEALAGFEAMEKRWAAAREDARVISRLTKQGPAPEDASRTRASGTRLIEFLESGKDWIKEQHRRLASAEGRMESDYRSVGAMVDALLEGTKRISMTPFSTLFDILPGMVRSLLSEQGKEAALIVPGGDVEVDRRVLEEMNKLLIHLVRNCVDHGLEKPGERVIRGKPPAGKISVAVSHRDSGKVELTVADDGTGIDIARVRTSAVRLAILSPDEAEKLDKEELLPSCSVRASARARSLATYPDAASDSRSSRKRRSGSGVWSRPSRRPSTARFSYPPPRQPRDGERSSRAAPGQFFVIPSAYVRRTVRVPSHDVTPVGAGRRSPLKATPYLSSILPVSLKSRREERTRSRRIFFMRRCWNPRRRSLPLWSTR